FLARAGKAMVGQPSPHTLPLEVQRALNQASASPPVAAATDDVIAGIPVRIIPPPGGTRTRGVYLHIHGGGWTMGSASSQDERLLRFATEVGVEVVSVEYRLAPEDPFPACADDCEAVASWLAEHRDEPLLIGGESAGAHLSAVTLLRMRDRGLATTFRGANLV